MLLSIKEIIKDIILHSYIYKPYLKISLISLKENKGTSQIFIVLVE
jgi:hypothetical protein